MVRDEGGPELVENLDLALNPCGMLDHVLNVVFRLRAVRGRPTVHAVATGAGGGRRSTEMQRGGIASHCLVHVAL